MENCYDVMIIGAGPAGLSAALYAGRSRLKTLLLEKQQDGGQIAITDSIENYPGCMDGETGPSLIGRMVRQAERFGVERSRDTITELDLAGEIKTAHGQKADYQSKTIILATGANPRPIGCPGEKELIGKGVSYCATCDAAFFEGMDVYVMGGGDAAVEEALYLAGFARQVTIIHRRDALRAARSIQERAFANPKLRFMWDSVITNLEGDGLLERMTVKNVKTGGETVINAPEEDGTFGVFAFIGFLPNNSLCEGKVAMEDGYIVTDGEMRTSLPGVYAAGDNRKKSLRQVVTAAADGAIAAMQAYHYISGV